MSGHDRTSGTSVLYIPAAWPSGRSFFSPLDLAAACSRPPPPFSDSRRPRPPQPRIFVPPVLLVPIYVSIRVLFSFVVQILTSLRFCISKALTMPKIKRSARKNVDVPLARGIVSCPLHPVFRIIWHAHSF